MRESRRDPALLRRRRAGSRAPEPDLARRSCSLLGRRLRLGPELARARHRLGPRRPRDPARAASSGARSRGSRSRPSSTPPPSSALARGASPSSSRSGSATPRDEESPAGAYDAALCLGASFVYGEPGRHARRARAGRADRAGTSSSASRTGGACRCPTTTRIATIRSRRSTAPSRSSRHRRAPRSSR